MNHRAGDELYFRQAPLPTEVDWGADGGQAPASPVEGS